MVPLDGNQARRLDRKPKQKGLRQLSRTKFVAAIVGSALLLTSCTSASTTATPAPSTSRPDASGFTLPSTPPASLPVTASAAPTSSTTVTTKPSVSTTTRKPTTSVPAVTTGPWPKGATPAQIVQVKAAIAAYDNYYKLIDRAFTAPGKDWSKEAAKLTADPVRSSLLEALKGTAKLGQYRTGTITVSPRATKVQNGLITLTDCVDATNGGYFDKSGKSIKAPNVAGSYFRHVSVAQVAFYVGNQWLVTFVTDDYNKTC